MGDRWAGCVARYEGDRLGFLTSARDECGGLVTFDVNTTIVNDLDLARTVLDSRAGFEIVGNFLNQRLESVDLARRGELRRHLNAGLRRGAVEHLAAAAATAAVTTVEAARCGRGDVLDPLPLFEEAISTVVAEFYFGASGEPVRVAVEPLLGALSRVFGSPFALPASWPTPTNLRVNRCYQRLRSVVDPLVASRLDLTRQVPDFASGVVRPAAAEGFGIGEISDLLIGSLLAAQRVPAAAAAWTLWELGRSPWWCAAARDSATHLQAAVLESLRLHPPTWRLHRVAIRPVELGGFTFPAGHNFVVSPYVIQRDPALFDRPTEYRPERWLEGGGRQPALLSFGHGLHRCPGRDASHVILNAAVGALVDRYDVQDVSTSVVPDPRTTLVPVGARLRLVPLGPRPYRSGP